MDIGALASWSSMIELRSMSRCRTSGYVRLKCAACMSALRAWTVGRSTRIRNLTLRRDRAQVCFLVPRLLALPMKKVVREQTWHLLPSDHKTPLSPSIQGQFRPAASHGAFKHLMSAYVPIMSPAHKRDGHGLQHSHDRRNVPVQRSGGQCS